ncbi:MAG TPA: GNAT family N-acetyltransferase, partial [Cryptosporangiaceae bacterium]|nr:GNAT family N-acetyltransferase [Cryptosporangiaceae bacterium]
MPLDVRPLDESDHASAQELRRLAFGGPRRAVDAEPPPPQPGRVTWGAFEGDRLVATAADRDQAHWFGGRLVPASGVASVAVAAADRGRGCARALLTALLVAVRERGAPIATLFPTAPALYRSLGWEQAGALTWSSLPTSAVAGIRLPAGMTLRAATTADSEAIRDLYTEVARSGNGYLDRTGPLFPEDASDALDGVTLAIGPDGAVEGYVGWDRGHGYDDKAQLTVYDLIGRTGRATAALLAALGTWSAVTPTLALRLPDPDPVRWLLPTAAPLARSTQPW